MVHAVEFVKSSTSLAQCPVDGLPEFAFIGRSNVGKSSLINALLNKKGVAKTSGRPGKTQLINHFIINKQWYLVDLPGYGFAKVSKKQQADMLQMVRQYLKGRETLLFAGILIDSRLEPQTMDLEFLRFLGQQGIPFVMIFTKADKIGYTKAQSAAAKYKRELLKEWASLPPVFVTSAEDQKGTQELLLYMLNLYQATLSQP